MGFYYTLARTPFWGSGFLLHPVARTLFWGSSFSFYYTPVARTLFWGGGFLLHPVARTLVWGSGFLLQPVAGYCSEAVHLWTCVCFPAGYQNNKTAKFLLLIAKCHTTGCLQHMGWTMLKNSLCWLLACLQQVGLTKLQNSLCWLRSVISMEVSVFSAVRVQLDNCAVHNISVQIMTISMCWL